MSNKNYIRGRQKEWEAIEELKKAGFSATRTAGSHGVFDIIAWNNSYVRFIQCKRVKTRLSIIDPAKHYKQDSQAISAMAVPSIASKEMWIWVDRTGWRKFELISNSNIDTDLNKYTWKEIS